MISATAHRSEIDRKRKRESEAAVSAADAALGQHIAVNKRLAVFLDPGSKDEAFWWPAIVIFFLSRPDLA